MNELYANIAQAATRFGAQKVVLFGSRARGDSQPRSDVDLAVFGMPKENEAAFRNAVDDLPTLLAFDVVFVGPSTSPALLENIRKDGIPLMDKRKEKAANLQAAVERLKQAIAEYTAHQYESMRDGAIQRFEFCAELAWKAAQDYMQAQGYLDVHSPKAVMRKAYAEHIITDEAGWLALLDARNQTSHLYDDEVASAVYQAIEGTYLPLLRALSEKLSAAV